MKTAEEYKKILWEKYKQSNDPEIEERYAHSLAVSEKALEIIDTFHLNVDKTKAEIAGILHDYAKFETMDKYKEIVKGYNLEESLLKLSPKILHAVLGPFIIHKELGIDDKEILDAIAYHTTGSLDMSTLAEVIFVADFTDKTRVEPYFDDVKYYSTRDFRKAILGKIEKRLLKEPNDKFSLEMKKKYGG